MFLNATTRTPSRMPVRCLWKQMKCRIRSMFMVRSFSADWSCMGCGALGSFALLHLVHAPTSSGLLTLEFPWRSSHRQGSRSSRIASIDPTKSRATSRVVETRNTRSHAVRISLRPASAGSSEQISSAPESPGSASLRRRCRRSGRQTSLSRALPYCRRAPFARAWLGPIM